MLYDLGWHDLIDCRWDLRLALLYKIVTGHVAITLPYLTLPYGEDVLPPSTEASNGPNAHPRINRKVTKSPSAVLTWVHTKMWNHTLPNEGLLTR